MLVANNIANGNQIEDMDVRSGDVYLLYNNNVDVLVGTVPDVAVNNINLPNRFENSSTGYVPAANSPLIDAGRSPCPFLCIFPVPWDQNWQLGTLDILMQSRLQGDAVDIGAYESSSIRDLIFWDRFE